MLDTLSLSVPFRASDPYRSTSRRRSILQLFRSGNADDTGVGVDRDDWAKGGRGRCRGGGGYVSLDKASFDDRMADLAHTLRRQSQFRADHKTWSVHLNREHPYPESNVESTSIKVKHQAIEEMYGVALCNPSRVIVPTDTDTKLRTRSFTSTSQTPSPFLDPSPTLSLSSPLSSLNHTNSPLEPTTLNTGSNRPSYERQNGSFSSWSSSGYSSHSGRSGYSHSSTGGRRQSYSQVKAKCRKYLGI